VIFRCREIREEFANVDSTGTADIPSASGLSGDADADKTSAVPVIYASQPRTTPPAAIRNSDRLQIPPNIAPVIRLSGSAM
jgi:hypothetical protein